MRFFGQQLVVSDEIVDSAKKQRNTGNKSEVLPDTVKLLDDFYRPYNRKMARLMKDDKWLYERT